VEEGYFLERLWAVLLLQQQAPTSTGNSTTVLLETAEEAKEFMLSHRTWVDANRQGFEGVLQREVNDFDDPHVTASS